jgi:Tfp pilus assembly protein PilF
MGCVHRAAVGRDFGLSGTASQRTNPKAGAGPAKIVRRPAVSPDASLRTIFQQQTQGAFNPLTDDERVQALQARLNLNPQDLAARLELAGVYENYRLYDDGFGQYTETLRLANSATAEAGNSALAEQAALGLGRCAQALRRPGQAIPPLEAFLKESPSANAWHELGLLYDELGDLTAGESALREAVARDAESDRLHNNLGYNLLLQNKAEEAEAEFRRALKLNPKSATTRNNLGTVLARRGDRQGALEQFQLAADAATAHNNLAVVLLETGQYEQSREELVKALSIRRYFAPALANFKLVQERIRERAELSKAGRLPPGAAGVLPVPAAPRAARAASGDRSPNRQDGRQEAAESKDPEDR